jgi:phage terminase Nu1 subunit (DNA packaging protein)
MRGRPSIADQKIRNRLINAQAERAERINRTEAGELLPAADVKSEWLDIALTIRTRLLAIPARVAALHPGHPAIIATLERELHSALASIADDDL